jgi:hypothetical protein
VKDWRFGMTFCALKMVAPLLLIAIPHGVLGQTNVRVNDPADDDVPSSTQATGVVASYQQFVVVGYVDSEAPGTAYSYSTDGGETFTEGQLPLAGSDKVGFTPSIVVDTKGNFYLCAGFLEDGVGGRLSAAVWKGYFESDVLVWDHPVVVRSVEAQEFLGYPYIAIDPREDERLYVAYVRFSPEPCEGASLGVEFCEAIGASRSLDGGETWTTLNDYYAPGPGLANARPVVLWDGSLCIFWERGANTVDCEYGSTTAEIRMTKVTDPTTGVPVSWGVEKLVAETAANWTASWGGNALGRADLALGVALDMSLTGPPQAGLYCVFNGSRHWDALPPPSAVPVGESEPNDDPETNAGNLKQLRPELVGEGSLGSGDVDYWTLDADALGSLLIRLEPQGWDCEMGRAGQVPLELTLLKPAATGADTAIATSYLGEYAPQIVYEVPEGIAGWAPDDYYLRVSGIGLSGTYKIVTRYIHGGGVLLDTRDIYVTASLDGGNTWWPSAQVVNSERFASQEERNNQLPAITVAGDGSVHVFWYASLFNFTGSGIMQHYYHAQWDGYTLAGERPVFSLAEPLTSSPLYFRMADSHLRQNFGVYNTPSSTRSSDRVYCTWSAHRVSDPDPDVYSAVVQGELPTDAAGAPSYGMVVVENAPNPFNPETVITFRTPSAGPVSLHIYDAAGRLVRAVLSDRMLDQGPHRFSWNGKSESGRAVPSGIYIAKLRVGTGAVSRKLVVAR